MTHRPTTLECFDKRWGNHAEAIKKAVESLDAAERVLLLRDAVGLYENIARQRVDELQKILGNPAI